MKTQELLELDKEAGKMGQVWEELFGKPDEVSIYVLRRIAHFWPNLLEAIQDSLRMRILVFIASSDGSNPVSSKTLQQKLNLTDQEILNETSSLHKALLINRRHDFGKEEDPTTFDITKEGLIVLKLIADLFQEMQDSCGKNRTKNF